MGNHNRIMRLKIPLSNSDIQKEYKPQKCKKEYSIAVGFANVVVSDIASQQIQEYQDAENSYLATLINKAIHYNYSGLLHI